MDEDEGNETHITFVGEDDSCEEDNDAEEETSLVHSDGHDSGEEVQLNISEPDSNPNKENRNLVSDNNSNSQASCSHQTHNNKKKGKGRGKDNKGNNQKGNNSYNWSSSHNSGNKSKNNQGNFNKSSSVDFFKQIKGAISTTLKHREVCYTPIDSLVLRLHYRLGVLIYLLAYNIVQGNWFLRDAIHCVEGYNAATTIPFHVKNICLSYPYVCENNETTSDEQDCSRRYILFYRWIYFLFLLLSGVYYIPRIIAKKAENPRLRKLIIDLAQGENRYDGSTWERDTEMMLNYMQSHISTHGSLYLWLVICHIVALVIDIGTIYFLDFLLHGRFLKLVYMAYPFHRDPQYFTDELSQTFPPFVNCTLGRQMLINNQRIDYLGCHLMLMELYEKVFIFIWIWLAIVTVCTALSVILLLVITLPPFNSFFLHMHSTSKCIKEMKRKVLKICQYGDLYVLYLMKRHRSEAQFIMFLTRFVHSNEESIEVIVESKHKNPAKQNEKSANTENITDVPNDVKSEKWLSKNRVLTKSHTLSTFTHMSGFSAPLNPNFEDQVRSRKFDFSTQNSKFRPSLPPPPPPPPPPPHFQDIAEEFE
ncbi:Innexin inx2-like 6 [Homarus americanus]|uniref:Innexin n=1 Tax=Homarus americanus TaxID=6706 RepID=A0A8J5K6Z0_HOMAM|nr:Innexin inx2-like 6 [Homarus americanus]